MLRSGTAFVLMLTLVACSTDPLFDLPIDHDAGTAARDGGRSAALNPSFAIDAPTYGELVTSREIEVRGTAVDLDEVLVAGDPIDVIAGAWRTVVTIDREGPHDIVVSAEGVAEQVVPIRIDLHPPVLEILDPPRGAFIEASSSNRVRVTGRVADAVSGVVSLTVNGDPVALTGDTFTLEISVEEGLNSIEAIAMDAVGRRSDVLQAAIYGEFVPFGEAMPDALSIGLAASVFEQFEAQFEQGILASLSSTTAFANNPQLQITAVDAASVDFEMTPRTGFFEFLFAMESVRIDFVIDTVVLGVPIRGPGAMTMARLEVETEAHLGVDPSTGQLAGQFEDSAATISEFGITITGVAPFLTRALANIIRPQIEAGLIEQIESQDLVAIFDFTQFLPPGTNARITDLRIDRTGVSIVTAAGIELPRDPRTPVAPGVLQTRSAPPIGAPTNAMVRIDLSDDLTNNFLFNTWRSGALTTTIAAPPPGQGGITLDAATLSLFFGDDLLDLAPGATVVGLEVRPLLPPVASFDGTSGTPSIDVALGDLLVDFRLEPVGADPIRFATFSVFLDLENDIAVVDDVVTTTSRTRARIDLAEAPLFRIDEETVESLLGGLLMGFGGGLVAGGVLPIDPAATLENLTIEVHGDYLRMAGDLPE